MNFIFMREWSHYLRRIKASYYEKSYLEDGEDMVTEEPELPSIFGRSGETKPSSDRCMSITRKETDMIITICGSAKFEAWYHLWNKVLTLAGHPVFALGAYPSHNQGKKNWYSPAQKERLDEVHRAKIDASDAILILNVFGYIGDSTMREMAHAKATGKRILVLEKWNNGDRIGPKHSLKVRMSAAYFLGEEPPPSLITWSRYESPWDGSILGFGDERTDLVNLIRKETDMLLNEAWERYEGPLRNAPKAEPEPQTSAEPTPTYTAKTASQPAEDGATSVETDATTSNEPKNVGPKAAKKQRNRPDRHVSARPKRDADERHVNATDKPEKTET